MRNVSRITKVESIVARDPYLWREKGFTIIVWIMAIASAFILFWLTAVVWWDALPAINKFGLEFITGTDWNPIQEKYGALPFIYGTLVSSAIAIILALPLGIGVALITSENFLPRWLRSPIAVMVELIASIPSVILGLWGIFVFIPLSLPLQNWLHENLGWIPLFSTAPTGRGMLVAGIVLTIMIIPTIAAITREVLLAIPKELRSASMALGSTRWEAIWRVILPSSVSGILGASALALGRALGETMAVAMVIGNSNQISASLLAPGYTIPAILANQFPEASGLQVSSLMYLSLILFVITLVVNAIAVLLVQLIGRES